jgi:hypothetical protein
MSLRAYFESTEGTGILATADADGKVDAAVYARPHVMEDGTVAFVMSNRLSHHNLQSNPHAAYLFMEKGPDYEGKRFFLTKVREDQDPELIKKHRRRSYPPEDEARMAPLTMVFFRIDKELPLIGAGPK